MDDEPLDKHRGTTRPRTRLWFLLALFFGILVIIAFGIISELMFSSDDIVISDGIFKNLLQVYEINTVCGLADLLLENHFSFQSYHEDFEKQLPTEWNERMSILESKEKFWNELTDEQITSRQTLTAEAEITLQKIEHRSKISYYTMIMKYFSISPDLEGEFVALYENMPWSLLWLKDKHPECTPLLEEKYG
ncbi:MAG: hypothetical protein IIC67_05015 [Thaumarchaeota archaeon]|nr:hypothetical protein [Nitrososphaerota archaeon]